MGAGEQAVRQPAALPPSRVGTRKDPAPSVIGGSKGHGPDKRRETSSSGSPAWFCPSFPGPGPPGLFP